MLEDAISVKFTQALGYVEDLPAKSFRNHHPNRQGVDNRIRFAKMMRLSYGNTSQKGQKAFKQGPAYK